MHSSNPNGTAADYDYDALNRLNSVTDSNLPAGNQKTTYSFDDVGNLSTVALPNGVTTSYSYNSVNRLLQLSTLNSQLSTPLASYAYTVGPAGNRLSVSELGGRSVSYTYDNLYRLKSETIAGATGTSPNGSISYAYDAVGNRQSRTSTVAGVPTQASVSVDDNDRLTTDGSDANGNTVTSNGKTYGYDFQNRLISVTGGGTSVSIVYDGDGNRVSKTVTTGGNSITTKYLVDTNNPTGYSQVIEEIQNGSVVRHYTYGLALISQRTLNSQLSTLNYFGYDGHGSVRFLTDATGAKTDTYDYDAFGVLIASTGNTPNNYLYCGEQFDPDLGMYFLRARYLNPRTGRFWTMDSYEGSSHDPASLHKYLYTNADPTNLVDPSGHEGLLGLLGGLAIRKILIGALVVTIGAIYGAVRAKLKGGSVIEGAGTGAAVALGGTILVVVVPAVAPILAAAGVISAAYLTVDDLREGQYALAVIDFSAGVLSAVGGLGLIEQVTPLEIPPQNVSNFKPTPGDFFYGPSARGKLAALAGKYGGRTLTDFPEGPGPLTWEEFSFRTLDQANRDGMTVWWDLTYMEDPAGIAAGTNTKYAGTVTAAELQYIKANWGRFQSNIKFIKDGQVVPPPW